MPRALAACYSQTSWSDWNHAVLRTSNSSYSCVICPSFILDALLTRLTCHSIDSTIPIHSTPRGASHRLRIWLRAPLPSPYPSAPYTPANGMAQNSICHRIWSTDNFKIGHVLDFSALGSRMVMGVPSAQGPKVQTSLSEQSMHIRKRSDMGGSTWDGTDSVGSPPDSMNERREVW